MTSTGDGKLKRNITGPLSAKVWLFAAALLAVGAVLYVVARAATRRAEPVAV